MKNWVAIRKQSLIEKYSSVIREKAIAKAKVEIALAGKRITDYDEDQLEVIVKDQQDKIIAKYRNTSLVALFLLLGVF